jgi:hypothetical protein
MITVEVYNGETGITLNTIELEVCDVQDYIELIKTHGFEDNELEEHKFSSASVREQGVIIYVAEE